VWGSPYPDVCVVPESRGPQAGLCAQLPTQPEHRTGSSLAPAHSPTFVLLGSEVPEKFVTHFSTRGNEGEMPNYQINPPWQVAKATFFFFPELCSREEFSILREA